MSAWTFVHVSGGNPRRAESQAGVNDAENLHRPSDIVRSRGGHRQPAASPRSAATRTRTAIRRDRRHVRHARPLRAGAPGQHLRDHARPRAAGAAIDVHFQRPRADLLQLQRRPDAVGRHGRSELGRIQPDRRPVVGDAGLRPAAQVHGERARRGRSLHPGAERGLRQDRPVGANAVHRPEPTTRPTRPISSTRRGSISIRSSASASPRGRT